MRRTGIVSSIGAKKSPSGGVGSPTMFLPFNDLGAGVANIVAPVGVAVTYSRASIGATRLSTGYWNLNVGVNSPRSYYSDTGRYDGFLYEPAKTNLCLHNRDLTQAATWIAVNVTPVKDQIGVDNVGNSASRITATAAGGTIIQTIAAAAALKDFACAVQRLVGVGTLEFTADGGVGWTDVTALVGTTIPLYNQMKSQSVLNPAFGFRFGTNGDSFIVDVVQVEDSTVTGTTTPIVTGAATAARSADIMNFSSSVLPTNNYSVTFTTAKYFSTVTGGGVVQSFVDANNWTVLYTSNAITISRDVAAAITTASRSGALIANTVYRAGYTVSSTLGAECYRDGIQGTIHDASTLASQLGATINIGLDEANVSKGCFTIKNLRIFNRALTQSQIQSIL